MTSISSADRFSPGQGDEEHNEGPQKYLPSSTTFDLLPTGSITGHNRLFCNLHRVRKHTLAVFPLHSGGEQKKESFLEARVTRLIIGFLVAGSISLSSSFAQEWSTYHMDPPGMRPRLALSSDGTAHIAYLTTGLFERDTTYYGVWNPAEERFSLTHVDTGAFDEHIDIELDRLEAPHLTHHTHIGGDVILSSLTPSGWVRERISTPGHDGFATSIKFDTDNNPHILFSDPGAFGGQGLEYTWHNGTQWNFELPGSGPSVWALYDINLELEANGTAHGVYYDTLSAEFLYARRSEGVWTISLIDGEGDNGRFSAMKLNQAGMPQVAYYHYIDDSYGIIKLASYDGISWSIQNIDTLYNVRVGPQVRSQSMISLDIDDAGNIHISYSDRSILRHAVVSSSETTREDIFSIVGSDTTLGQSTSIKVAPDGSVHLAFWLRQQGLNTNWPVYMIKSAPATPPLDPILASPPDDATNLTTSVLFHWRYLPGAQSYHFQLGSDSLMTILVHEDSLLTDTITTVASLANSSTYYWRVRARNHAGWGRWSNAWRFSTIVSLPGAVTLETPGADAIVRTRSAIFRWVNIGPFVDRFRIELCQDSLFRNTGTRNIFIDSLVTDTTRTIAGLVSEKIYYWRVSAHNTAGWGPTSAIRRFFVSFSSPLPLQATLSTAADGPIPADFEVGQNYPNPFNATSTIRYGVPVRSSVSIMLFNLLGQQVAVLENNEKAPGYHSAFINGTSLGSGTYFYRMVVTPLDETRTPFVETKRIMLLK